MGEKLFIWSDWKIVDATRALIKFWSKTLLPSTEIFKVRLLWIYLLKLVTDRHLSLLLSFEISVEKLLDI